MLVAAVLMLALSGAVSAKIYKWVDDGGQVHYGQEPPHGIEATPITVHTAPASPGGGSPAAPGKDDNAKGAPESANAKDEGADKGNTPEDVLAENCKIARQNLDVLQKAGPNGRYRQPDGEVMRYQDGQWQARVDQNKQFLEKHCQDQ